MTSMNSLKTLMLAGAAALSIGVGGAMAADSGAAGANWGSQQQPRAGQAPVNQGSTVTTSRNGTVQFGSSDYDALHQPAVPDPSLGVAGGF